MENVSIALEEFELSEFTKELFVHGLRKRYPDLSEEEFKKIILKRLHPNYNTPPIGQESFQE